MEKIRVNEDRMIFSDEEKKSAINCLNNSDTSIFVSNVIPTFEKNFSNYLNQKYAIALPNCTLSIYACLQALEISSSDEVIVPNLTHASSIYPILMSGAKIRVCDFLPNSYNYDINHLEKLITKKTRFVVVCYLYGMPLNIAEIANVCKKYNLILIEDTAQAFGTKIDNKFAGTFGDVGCYSFNDTKMLRIGEGGAIVTNNEKTHDKIEHFRHVGEVFKYSLKSSVSTNSTYRDLLYNGLSNMGRGLNLRPSTISFSTGVERLKVINTIIKKRQEKLKIYVDELSNVEGINFIHNFDKNKINDCAPIACWILLDNKFFDRNRIILGAINMGIPVGSFNYNTILKNDYFNQFILNKDDTLNNSQYVRDNSIFLPLYETISEESVKNICEAFKYVLNMYDTNDKIFDEKVLDEPIDYFDGFYLMRK